MALCKHQLTSVIQQITVSVSYVIRLYHALLKTALSPQSFQFTL